MDAFLSVIMPTYNGERYLAAALESVRGQWTDDIELIVVDDGSSDRTLEIVREFEAKLPIRLITPGRIGNWVAVSNIGLREARGEWACFLHQDDSWLPGRLMRILPEARRAECALILHNAQFIGPDGRNLGRWTCPLPPGEIAPEKFVEHLLVQNFIAIPSPLFRRKPAIDSGGLDESLWFSADWDLWLRLAAMAPVQFIPQVLAAFRIHPASQTAARPTGRNEWEQQLATVLDRHLEAWPVTGRRRQSVIRAAKASISVNSTLSAVSRGGWAHPSGAILQVVALGPSGWRRYLRDSRIVQRVGSRLKLKLSSPSGH
jgi:hypothetical protein